MYLHIVHLKAFQQAFVAVMADSFMIPDVNNKTVRFDAHGRICERLQIKVTKALSIDFRVYLTHQVGADFRFLWGHLHIV